MTARTRSRVIVEGLDALRAFHGHTGFCEVCEPVVEKAARDHMFIKEVKVALCPVGLATFVHAFKKTGGKSWGVRIYEKPKRTNANPPEAKEEEPALSTAAPVDPEPDRRRVFREDRETGVAPDVVETQDADDGTSGEKD